MNRRELLAGSALSALILAMPEDAQARTDDATPFGKVNLELNGIADYGLFYPFINIVKSGTALQFFNRGSIYTTKTPSGEVGSAFGIYCDDDGECLVPLPSGTTGFNRIFYEQNGKLPAGYPGRLGTPMIMDWTGGSGWTGQVLGASPNYSSRKSPLAFKWQSDTANLYYNFTAGNLNDPPKNIRIYRASDQDLINTGKVFDPAYVASTRAGAGMVRMMDWQNTNNNDVTNTVEDFMSERSISWGSSGYGGNRQAGVPLSVLAKFAIVTNKHPWICIPQLMAGGGKSAAIQAISNSNTATITTYGSHRYVDGDQVLIYLAGGAYGAKVVTYADQLFALASHGFVNGQAIAFGQHATGLLDTSTYPTGIAKQTSFFVVNRTNHTFQVSATKGGAPLVLTGPMSGPCNVYFGGMVKLLNPSYSKQVFTLDHHGLVNGQCVLFGVDINGSQDRSTYPAGIAKRLPYYVINQSASTFQISRSVGGEALSLSGSMSGPCNVYLSLNRNIYRVINSQPARNTFDISGPGADTSTWSSAAPFAGTCAMPYDLEKISTAVGRLAAYFRDNLPTKLVPVFQYSNEAWNSQFTAFHFCAAQSRQNFNEDIYQAWGFLAAACMKAVRDAYGADRARYKTVIDTQTGYGAGGDISPGIFTGIQTYIKNHSPALKIRDLFDYISPTTYYGGNCYRPNGPATATTFSLGSPGTVKFAGLQPGPNGPPYTFATSGTALPTDLGTGLPLDPAKIYWIVGVNNIAASPNGAPISLGGMNAGPYTSTFCPTTVIEYLMTISENLNLSSPKTHPTKFTFFNQAISDDTYDGRWTWNYFNIVRVTNLIQHIKITYAVPNGLGLIAYEGGDSNSPAAGFLLINDLRWREFYSNSQYCQGNWDNFVQMGKAFTALGGVYPSQFSDVASLSINFGYGNFGAQQWIGDNNLRWQGVVAFNNS